MKSDKQKHILLWFINRVGKQIKRNNNIDLFNPAITIADDKHAHALYVTQVEKNFTYEQI